MESILILLDLPTEEVLGDFNKDLLLIPLIKDLEDSSLKLWACMRLRKYQLLLAVKFL